MIAIAATAVRPEKTNTDQIGKTSMRPAPIIGPTRLPTRCVPPSAVIAFARSAGGITSATTACRARLHTSETGPKTMSASV